MLKEVQDQRLKDIINLRISKKGYPFVGIPGSCTALIGAMTVGSADVASVLLENGADPYITDNAKNDPFTLSCMFGRIKNAKFCERFPKWI